MFKALKSSELLEPYPSGCARHRVGDANFSFSAWFASRSGEFLLERLVWHARNIFVGHVNALVNELVVQKHLQTVKPTVGRKLWDLVQLQRQNCRRDPMRRPQSDAKEVVLVSAIGVHTPVVLELAAECKE